MRRLVLTLVVALAAPVLGAPLSEAGTATSDVYRSHFLARDRYGRAYAIDAVLEDRPAGAQLVLEVRRRCKSCRAEVYAKTLQPGDLVVQSLGPTSTGCQCMSAWVTVRFGGKDLRIDWSWDVEQRSGPAGSGYEWATVSAINGMNLSCFGSGTYSTTPDPFSGEAPEPPPRAKAFPKEMPAPFKADLLYRPGCYSESP